MAAQEVIKEFLAAIGWQNDEVGMRKALASVDKMEKSLKGVIVAAEAASLAVVAALGKMAEHFEKAYYASSRTGASVRELNAFKYAASQLGSTAEEATSAVEGLALKIRENRGYRNLVQSITGDKTGDYAKQITELGDAFAHMSSERAHATASMLGIPEHLLLALQNPQFRQLEKDYSERAGAMGVDLEKAAKDGKNLTQALRDIRSSLDLIVDAAGSTLFQKLAGPLKDLNDFLVAHGQGIAETIGTIASALVSMTTAILTVTPKIADFLIKMTSDDIAKAAPLWKPLGDEFGRILGFIEKILDAMKTPAWRFFTDPGGLGKDAGKAVDSFEDKDFDGKEKPGGFTLQNSWNWFKNKLGYGGARADGSTESNPHRGAAGHNAAEILKYQQDQLIKEGVSPANARAAAAALGGNVVQESGGDPTKVHDNGTGYGIYGARLQRRDRMFAWLAKNGYGRDSVEGQARYMAHEAMTDPTYRPTANALRNATPANLGETTNTVAVNFEAPAPASANYGGRRNNAARIYAIKEPVKDPAGGAKLSLPSKIPAAPSLKGTGGATLNPDATRSLFNAKPLGAVSNDNSKSVTYNDNKTVNVSGVSDPSKAADHVGAVNDRHSSLLIRNMQSAVG